MITRDLVEGSAPDALVLFCLETEGVVGAKPLGVHPSKDRSLAVDAVVYLDSRL